jgi:hypothetical protein
MANGRLYKTKFTSGEQEKNGSLIYGYHINKENVISCYIEIAMPNTYILLMKLMVDIPKLQKNLS